MGFVYEYLTKRANIDVTVLELQQESGYDRRQIQNAVSNSKQMIKDKGLAGEIVTLVSGSVYRYVNRPEMANGSRPLLEVLATAKDSALICQDEEGRIFRAVEL